MENDNQLPDAGGGEKFEGFRLHPAKCILGKRNNPPA